VRPSGRRATTDLYAPPASSSVPAAADQGSRRERLAAVGTAAFVVAGTGLALVLTASPGPGTPQETVERFVSAAAEGDYRASFGLLCSDYQAVYGSLRAYASELADDDAGLLAEGYDVRVTDVSFDADDGHDGFLVTTVFTQFGARDEVDFFVVREDGHFRVCGISGA